MFRIACQVSRYVRCRTDDARSRLYIYSFRTLVKVTKVAISDDVERARNSSCRHGRKIMTANGNAAKPFTFRFIDAEPGILLELTNAAEQTLKSIEILTIFLKDEETPGGGPSQAHIRFETIKSMLPKETAVLSHRTWINGRPAASEFDQLERLRVVTGESTPYVLDISWEDPEGKARYQRIPLGH